MAYVSAILPSGHASPVSAEALTLRAPELPTFGPFFEGKYDALVASFNKRLSNRYLLGGELYLFQGHRQLARHRHESDGPIHRNRAGRDRTLSRQAIPGCTRQTNANAPFTSRNGNLVQQAGTFHNGPDLDKGPSPLALDHIFQVNGLVDLPWQFQIGGIFRAQSGFHFSRFDEASRDPDGNGNFNGIDFTAGRNAFTAPPFVNVDLRFSKRFDIGERVKVQILFEFFNLFNRQNPAVVYNRADSPLVRLNLSERQVRCCPDGKDRSESESSSNSASKRQSRNQPLLSAYLFWCCAGFKEDSEEARGAHFA